MKYRCAKAYPRPTPDDDGFAFAREPFTYKVRASTFCVSYKGSAAGNDRMIFNDNLVRQIKKDAVTDITVLPNL